MDGRFPFYYAQGSFPMQNFSHFHPTLAGPFSDQAGPSGILSNRPDSPASVVTDSDSPTSSISSEGLQETQKKHYRRVVVMNYSTQLNLLASYFVYFLFKNITFATISWLILHITQPLIFVFMLHPWVTPLTSFCTNP